jgi:very-short-patch-repair endonuclease
MSEKANARRDKASPEYQEYIKKIVYMYFDQGMSSYEIAEKVGTYAKKISRDIEGAGYQLRDYSASQSLRIANNPSLHPTKGKKRSKETKEKISQSVAEQWKAISPEEHERRREICRDNFAARTDKEEMKKKGLDAIRKAAETGSKLEKYLADLLVENGYYVLIHQKHQIQDKKMHLDILLPVERIAIEVDGPSHYTEAWGSERLAGTQKADNKKNGLLLACGHSVVRVRQPEAVSQYFARTTGEALLELLNNIKGKSPKIYRI